MKLIKDTIIARTYVISNGQQEHALIRTSTGKYMITVNGDVNDARAALTIDEAREFFDDAAYKIEARP